MRGGFTSEIEALRQELLNFASLIELELDSVESLNLFAQSSGIKVQANQGKVEVQAQNDELQLNAL